MDKTTCLEPFSHKPMFERHGGDQYERKYKSFLLFMKCLIEGILSFPSHITIHFTHNPNKTLTKPYIINTL
jgi:hypothetical protein